MKKIFILFFICFNITAIKAQDLSELDDYRVDDVYEKVELDYGTLNEDGDDIEYVFLKKKSIGKTGLYEIELSDGPGDLYHIKGTDLYITFAGYFGYAGYSKECYLDVGSYGSSTVYKIE